MKYLLLTFKSRNELYLFAKMLKIKGFMFSIINTPSNIASSCTLSIKTDFRNFEQIKNLITSVKPKTLLGLFLVQTNNSSFNSSKIL